MFVIRSKQFGALQYAFAVTFLHDQARLLFPAACVSELADIVAGFWRASRLLDTYGLQEHSDQARFFQLAARGRHDAEAMARFPWVCQILSDPLVSNPSRRMARLAAKIEAADLLEHSNAEVQSDFFDRLRAREQERST